MNNKKFVNTLPVQVMEEVMTPAMSSQDWLCCAHATATNTPLPPTSTLALQGSSIHSQQLAQDLVSAAMGALAFGGSDATGCFGLALERAVEVDGQTQEMVVALLFQPVIRRLKGQGRTKLWKRLSREVARGQVQCVGE